MKKIAFVFPGQGSQSLGMLSQIASEHPVVAATFNECSQAIGVDLWRLTQEGPAEDLNQTQNTQPVLLAASVALYRLIQEKNNFAPFVLAGHSLGEYSALVCAGALTLSAAAKLVFERGQLMQQAVPAGMGAMAAILGLDPKTVATTCEEISTKQNLVTAANFNSLEQTVIAGHKEAVFQAVEILKAKGAKRALVLPVSVPSHCMLMESAAASFATRLLEHNFAEPVYDVIHNFDVQTHKNPTAIRACLINQLTSPVRWVDTILKFENMGVTHVVECGPGKVLTGLIKRISPSIQLFNIDSPALMLETVQSLSHMNEV